MGPGGEPLGYGGVTQCNSSGNGGGGTLRVQCTVPVATRTAALPVTVNQCNGSGNGGGATVTCTVSLVNSVQTGRSPACRALERTSGSSVGQERRFSPSERFPSKRVASGGVPCTSGRRPIGAQPLSHAVPPPVRRRGPILCPVASP
ncbi:MAG: hypothetical protein JWL64_2452 [Frankiales bacterium]|nr:hypothetical protein [Frankiales bacterium]